MANLKNTTINDTGFLRLPSGTTAQRPGSPSAGMMRYNNTDSRIEFYNGEYWNSPSLLFTNNVHPNSTDIVAWSGTTGHTACTVSRDSIASPFSNTPLRMAVTGNDPHLSTYNSSTWNLAAAANGQTWQVRVFCKASTSTTAQIFMFGAQSNGVWSGQSGTIGADGYNVTTSWQELIFQYTFANAGVAFVQCRLDGPDTGGSGQTLWFDGLQVRRLS
jgi:hypothetical protein